MAEFFMWSKDELVTTRFPEMPEDPMWGPLVLALDPLKDVILFPSEDAIVSSDFDWFPASTSTESVSEGGSEEQAVTGRYRLVVLEATWNHAKAMIRSIATYRSMHGLPPIRCVKLENVVGKYWRFHHEGHSALSTIEAIVHTAKSAGMGDEDCETLLTLFYIQRGRVLLNIDELLKAPRAVAVHGTGDGSWIDLFIEPLPSVSLLGGEKEENIESIAVSSSTVLPPPPPTP
jgi:hypothetical protein